MSNESYEYSAILGKNQWYDNKTNKKGEEGGEGISGHLLTAILRILQPKIPCWSFTELKFCEFL